VVRAIERDAAWLSALIMRKRSNDEVWTFELPSITLRRRHPLDPEDMPMSNWTVTPAGMLAGWQVGPSGALDQNDCRLRAVVVDADGRRRKILAVNAPGAQILRNVVATNEWVVLAVTERTEGPIPHEGPTIIRLLDSKNLAVRARITIDGSELTGARIQGDRLIIFDSGGRVIVMSLTS